MEHLRWEHRPTLRQPVVIAAFEGWNDAGDASTAAVRYLRDRWDAVPFATIDAEDFFDFTVVRPRVSLVDGEQREIAWPDTELYAATVPGTDVDVILMLGVEPQLRWRTFCSSVTGLAMLYDSRLVLCLGALLAEVPHSRPVTVIGTASEPATIEAMDLTASCYEGPTGIVGVLHDAAAHAGFRAASLWAEVPTYVPAAQSPKATLALVERTAQLLRVPMVTTDLEILAAAYERQISDLVAADDETAEYVARLEYEADRLSAGLFDEDADDEEAHDEGADAGRLVEELERYLRESPPQID